MRLAFLLLTVSLALGCADEGPVEIPETPNAQAAVAPGPILRGQEHAQLDFPPFPSLPLPSSAPPRHRSEPVATQEPDVDPFAHVAPAPDPAPDLFWRSYAMPHAPAGSWRAATLPQDADTARYQVDLSVIQDLENPRPMTAAEAAAKILSARVKGCQVKGAQLKPMGAWVLDALVDDDTHAQIDRVLERLLWSAEVRCDAEQIADMLDRGAEVERTWAKHARRLVSADELARIDRARDLAAVARRTKAHMPKQTYADRSVHVEVRLIEGRPNFHQEVAGIGFGWDYKRGQPDACLFCDDTAVEVLMRAVQKSSHVDLRFEKAFVLPGPEAREIFVPARGARAGQSGTLVSVAARVMKDQRFIELRARMRNARFDNGRLAIAGTPSLTITIPDGGTLILFDGKRPIWDAWPDQGRRVVAMITVRSVYTEDDLPPEPEVLSPWVPTRAK